MKKPFEMNNEKWVELHGQLQDMLAGYADNELDDEQVLLVEAHLAGCELCRNDLSRQQLLIQRLEAQALPRMTSELHQKIDLQLRVEAAQRPTKHELHLGWFNLLSRLFNNWNLTSVFGMSGWAVAIVLALLITIPAVERQDVGEIPMIQDALSEYHELQDKTLPVTHVAQTLQAPVNWPDAHLLASWKTTVAGSEAVAYALRSGNNIVFQYRINESVFFRNPVVRQAIGEFGNYKVRTNKTDVLALPLTSSGILVIGPENSLPESSLMTLESI